MNSCELDFLQSVPPIQNDGALCLAQQSFVAIGAFVLKE